MCLDIVSTKQLLKVLFLSKVLWMSSMNILGIQSLAIKVMLLLSCSVMSDSLWTHKLQRSRLPCLSLSPWVCSDSCPLNQWCHPTISFSVVLFFSCLQSFPASWSFPKEIDTTNWHGRVQIFQFVVWGFIWYINYKYQQAYQNDFRQLLQGRVYSIDWIRPTLFFKAIFHHQTKGLPTF